MDLWEGILKDYSLSNDFRYYFKLLQTVAAILKEDLAHFEIEWITETFLYKPISILEVISLKRKDEAWLKVISDSFKVLADIVTKHWIAIQNHCEDLITCCELSYYDAETRKHAIHCLIAILKRPEVRLNDVTRHIRALEEATTCKKPLALLVGVICEYHDDQVESHYQRIWRTFINMLGANSKTQTVIQAVLQGIDGLLRSFGDRLPMAELNSILYNNMVQDFVKITVCEEVVLKILEHHANLFKERLAEDKSLRDYIWSLIAQRNDKNGALALRSIYQVVFTILDVNRLENIVDTEIVPRCEHPRTLVKYTAMRILTRAKSRRSASAALACNADCDSLQMELNGALSYERAEAVSYCIEANTRDSERLLLAAILFFENIPAYKRKEVVVYGVLKAPEDIRKAAVVFLINQSCEDGADRFLPIWKDLLGNVEEEMYEASRSAFECAVSYLLDQFVSICEELELPARLTSLLNMTSQVLSICPQDNHTTEACVILLPVLVKLAKRHNVGSPLLSVIRAAMGHMEGCDVTALGEVISLEKCTDEASLCETCLVLISNPQELGSSDSLLLAFKIIFSRSDVEPRLLSEALKKFSALLERQPNIPNEIRYEIIGLIERLRSRKDMIDKDGRVLHRDVVMFLGKYGYTDNIDIVGHIAVLKAKELLNVSLPNALDGAKPLQLNLQRVLEIAIANEEPDVLQTLLTIVVANWDTVLSRATDERQSARQLVARLLHAACRAHTQSRNFSVAALQRAIRLCDAPGIISCISSEISPGARRMLSDCLEELLTMEQTEATHPLGIVCERVIVMLDGDYASVKAGLDIAQSLIPALEDNNDISVLYLPLILRRVSKIPSEHAHTVFNLASTAFNDKQELFDRDDIEKLTDELILNGLGIDVKDFRPYKQLLELILQFAKDLNENCENNILELTVVSDEISFVNSLYVLSISKNVYGLDLEASRRIWNKIGGLLGKLFEFALDEDLAKWDAVLMCLKEYALVFLELEYQKTVQYIGNLVANLTPEIVIQIENTLSSCLLEYRAQLKKFPRIITSNFEDRCRTWKIADINLKSISYSNSQTPKINALRILSDIFEEIPLYETIVWTEKILELYRTKHFRGLKIKMAVLSDLLTVAAKSLKMADVKRLFLDNGTRIAFCRTFFDVYYEKFLVKPFVLLDGCSESYSLLLDVVKCFKKKNCPEDNFGVIEELINELWTKFEANTGFNEKHSILVDLMSLPKKLKPESKPVQWAVSVLSSIDGAKHEKVRLIGILPAGDEFRACYLSYASGLPTRLSEMQGDYSPMFRGLLDALSATGDLTLFEIVVTLSAGDDSKGWWDEALDSCMRVLALKGDVAMYQLAFRRCWDGMTVGVCRRILVPLLRSCSARFCEEFFSTIINELFTILRRGHRTPSVSKDYQKTVVTYIKVFTVLEVAFEKIPYESLESANSVLHQQFAEKKAWISTTETCKLCVSLRERVTCPVEATDVIRETCRLFHCAAYNCLAAAICRKRPDERFYKFIFNAKTWASVVDDSAVYKLFIQPRWRYRGSRRHAVAIDVVSDAVPGSLSSRTVGTRLFLRTLSENPLQYDMIETEEEPTAPQEMQLQDSELNAHECAATLGALLRHAASLPHVSWRDALVSALVGDLSRHTKWLLAQAICNAADNLKPHAEYLREPLFKMVVDTTSEDNFLNGLHIDLLNVLADWSEDLEVSDRSCINKTVEYLVHTCIHFKHLVNVYKTVLDTLDRVVKVYGSVVTLPRGVFAKYLDVIPKDVAIYLQLLQHLLRNNIYVPETLPMLDKYDVKYWRATPKMAEVLGMAANICPDSDRECYLTKFRSMLDKIKSADVGSFVKLLYYAQKWCNRCCDERLFQIVADLAQKIEKAKCLSIISSYMEGLSSPFDRQLISDVFHTMSICELVMDDKTDISKLAMGLVGNGLKLMDDVLKRRVVLLISSLCSHSMVDVRKAAFGVIMKAFEDIFPSNQCPPTKKQKTELTQLLRVLESEDSYTMALVHKISCGVLDRDQKISEPMKGFLEKYLSEEFSARFAECFFVTVCLPSKDSKICDLQTCLSCLLELLFSRLMNDEGFKERKLRDEDPMETSVFDDVGRSKLLTLSTTYQGTFRSAVQRRANTKREEQNIDVTLPVAEILNSILNFTKINSEAAQALCVQVMRRLRGPGFDIEAAMSRYLAAILSRNANSLTPFVLDSCLVFLDAVSGDNRLIDSVETLRHFTKGSDGFEAVKLLHEDLLLRSKGLDLFVLGVSKQEFDTTMNDDVREFSLEDLISIFGKLSDWDTLRIQDKRLLDAEGIPKLWTTKEDFTEQLRLYLSLRTDDKLWFDKMAVAYSGHGKENVMRWLREIDEWPRRQFVVSAVTEAVLWLQECEATPTCDVRVKECLAEWSARLMIRSAHALLPTKSSEDSPISSDCRIQELRWCREANRRRLPKLVLQCIDRNKSDLCSNEVLSWSAQRVDALRAIGIESNDDNILSDALQKAEKSLSMFKGESSIDTRYEMEKLILQLNSDLKSLTRYKLNESLKELEKANSSDCKISSENSEVLKAIYNIAMVHYDDLFADAKDSTQDDIIADMSTVIKDMMNNNLVNNYDLLFTLLFNRLASFDTVLSENTARILLEQIQIALPKFDAVSADTLKSILRVFPEKTLQEYRVQSIYKEQELESCKQCLQLVGSAAYSLLSYCSTLEGALKANDVALWTKTFDNMKLKIFENPFAGSDYKLLTRYKNRLYDLYTYRNSSATAKTLSEIIKDLGHKRYQQSVLRFSQLCSNVDGLVSKRDPLKKLLALNKTYVVKIYDEVSVFKDSVRRPCVIRVLLSNGHTRRYLHKTGESLSVDAVLQRCASLLPVLCNADFRGYDVTPLSEDCGVIEFLEDHKRLRAMMTSVHHLEDVVMRAGDDQLILSPAQSLQSYRNMCAKIPTYILRSAIEQHSSCTKDFIAKKKVYLETLASMTVVNWLFGVGDRHLQNLMYNLRDGAVCGVDGGAAFQFGVAELPPARLTAALLAVTDVRALESRIQDMMFKLRDCVKLYTTFIHLSFKWMGEEFQEKFSYVKNILEGKLLSYHITKDSLLKSKRIHRDKYIELLDDVFGKYTDKQTYTVDEQVSCLLQQCTDPRILSVTRSGWEPWI